MSDDTAAEAGCPAGGVAACRLRAASAVFRSLSDECFQHMLGSIEEHTFESGEHILEPAKQRSGCFYFIQDGTVCVADGTMHSDFAFGETVLLGLSHSYPFEEMWAVGPCVVRVLCHDDFAGVLADHPGDRRRIRSLTQEVPFSLTSPRAGAEQHLLRMLHAVPMLRDLGKAFVASLGKQMEDAFIAPGEAIFTSGDKCSAAETPLYLILHGRVHIEDEDGMLLRTASAGETLGEAGALGIVDVWSSSARAWSEGMVYCVRLCGDRLAHILQSHPREQRLLREAARGQEEAEQESRERKQEWIAEAVLPALARTPLFTGCSEEFLWSLAVSAEERTYDRGRVVTSVGEPADSMLVVLEGLVELESKSGVKIGRLSDGGAIGEVEVLGLFSQRVVTARTLTPCCMLSLSEESLQRALSRENAAPLRENFAHLVQSRHDQVAHGMPLCALSIGAQKDDIGVRTLALHTERVHVQAGDFWAPVPDSDPCGPCLGILVRGRAAFECCGHTDRRKARLLPPGSLLPEGLVAQSGVRVQFLSDDCEIYRVRLIHLQAAARLAAQSPDWYYRLRILEQDSREQLQKRIHNIRGVVEGSGPHKADSGIRDWTARRQRSISRAQQMRQKRAGEFKLPPLFEPAPQVGPQNSLVAYPVFKLSHVKSAPQLVFGSCRA